MDKIAFLILLTAIGSCTAVNNSCTSVGKFIADSNCTSYVVCSIIDNQFTSYTIPCPPGFMVRHSDMVCSIAGTRCEPSYTCTNVGNFTNPVSVNPSIYISCIQGIGDNIIATIMECPAPLEFNATIGSCQLKSVHGIVNEPAEPTSTGVNSTIPTNVQVEAVTDVNPPSIAATTTQKKSNGSVTMVASHHTVLAAISAFLLFYKF